MPKFRKKPVEIEAYQVPAEGLGCSDEMWLFLERSERDIESIGAGYLRIHALEGLMDAAPGDWIIRGTAGEYYPCEPEIFADIYEPV